MRPMAASQGRGSARRREMVAATAPRVQAMAMPTRKRTAPPRRAAVMGRARERGLQKGYMLLLGAQGEAVIDQEGKEGSRLWWEGSVEPGGG